MSAYHSTPEPYHPARQSPEAQRRYAAFMSSPTRAYHPAYDSPAAKAVVPLSVVTVDSPTAVYPTPSVMMPPPAAPRGGYHKHSSRSAHHYNEDEPGREDYRDAHKKSFRLVADEPRTHGSRKRDAVPGTPHPNLKTLERGVVPLSVPLSIEEEQEERDAGVDYESLRANRPATHSSSLGPLIRRIDSPLYKPEPRSIHYSIPFTHEVWVNGPQGTPVSFEVQGTKPGMYPSQDLRGHTEAFFKGVSGSVTYVFQAKGFGAVYREVILYGSGFRRDTIASGACELVRSFYRSHRHLGIREDDVVVFGLVKRTEWEYVVVAGVKQ